MSEPLKVTVVRFRCPFCPYSASRKAAVAEDLTRCWRNPAVRSCKTCEHFVHGQPGNYDSPAYDEYCAEGRDLHPFIDILGVAEPNRSLPLNCPKWQERPCQRGVS